MGHGEGGSQGAWMRMTWFNAPGKGGGASMGLGVGVLSLRPLLSTCLACTQDRDGEVGPMFCSFLLAHMNMYFQDICQALCVYLFIDLCHHSGIWHDWVRARLNMVLGL